MRLIRIPIGSTEKDKKSFVKEMFKIFPNKVEEDLIESWKRYRGIGVLQIIMDVDTETSICVQNITDQGAYWTLSSRFLKEIPVISEFDPNRTYFDNPMQSTFGNDKKKEFVLDDLLTKISVSGHDSLSSEEKNFLKKYI